jgi:hypothetical protein
MLSGLDHGASGRKGPFSFVSIAIALDSAVREQAATLTWAHARISRKLEGAARDGLQLADRRAMQVRPAPRWRESTMTLQIRRFATVGTLAFVLFLAGAGASHARDLSSAGAWGWLQGLWSQGVSWLGGSSRG